MPLPRLVHALALTIALAVLTALVVTLAGCSPGGPVAVATSAVETPWPISYSPPAGPVDWSGLAVAVQEQNTARWYAWASTLPAPAPPAPRPRPAPAAAPSSPAPRASGDAADAIARYFGDIYDQAWGVSGCESGHNPGAVSPGGGNWGLFQINTSHRADFIQFAGSLLDGQGAPSDDPRRTWEGGTLNADLNAAYARKLYNGSGWAPWSCRWAA